MAVENPPLNRLYVLGYAANDRDYPIVSMNLDPRVAGYKVPEDLSICPDKRYPNHVFTGAQPISGDERVRHVWEILPSPWVPFTRYDDDLGPVQGRRRSVKNDGQVASRESNKQVTYDAREGSAIVYTELEETWSITTDEDGNSLFPIRDRDFYDASRGSVQERRQLFVPTGEEVGSLENVNGVITQTSYEPYNEFLSVKIVQTYKVDGPQLIGNATDNDGQLVTVYTQRKGALDYVPPSPTATRTVEISREDAESLVERIVDTPEVFKANTFSVERPDPIPQKFRVAVPIQSSQEIVEGTAETPTLEEGEISKSEEQRNKFIKRISSTSRDQTVLPQTLTGKTTNNERQEVTVTETLQEGDTDEIPTATKTVESEALGDGNYVITKTEVEEVFGAETYRKVKEDLTPQKFRGAQEESTTEENVEGLASPDISLSSGEFSKSEQQINKFVKRVSTTSRTIDVTEELSESVLTPEGLQATRTLTLSNGPQSFTPSATLIDANVEALGDGRTVKTETVIPKIFAGETFSVEKPDPLPQKFRVAAKTLTTQTTEEGTAEQPDLVAGELSKSEQQVTEFVKRTSTTSRDQTQLPVTLIQRAVDNDRQSVTVTETLQTTGPIEPNSATVTIQSEALGDGNFVVTKSEVPEVFSAESYQKTKADLTPQKFRAAQEDLVFEETVEGEAQEPNLSEDEFAKTEQQVNKFVKRVSTTTRSIEETTELSEKVLTPQGQIGTRTLTLSKQNQSFTPSATLVDANVEALGDGRTIKTEVVVPSVFANKTISKTKADLTPQKFRSAQEDTTTEETLAGEATEPSLAENEFSKSEQQVTEFVKRVTTNVRDIETSTTLEEKVVTPDGQLATRTLRLSKEAQTIDPDELTVDGSIEALGDGRTIKTETKAPSVLELPVFSVERPDATPAKFRVAVPTATEQKTIVGDAEKPSLQEGEISKSEQQQTKFVKRTTVTKRDQDQLPKTLTQKTTTNEGLLATVTETLKEGDTTEQPNATKTVESEALGDGNYVIRTTEAPEVFSAKTFSKEAPDPAPLKFRIASPTTTEEETVEGEAENPTLETGDIAKSEQQINKFTKRLRSTFRNLLNLPKTIVQKATNNEGQLVTVRETLQVGDATEQPTAKRIVESEALGDGTYVVRVTEAPEVFKAQTFRAEKADLTPQKFRSKQIDTTKEETIEGQAEEPSLGENEFSKTEQQVNKFVKRVTTTERETDVTETLNEKVLTPDGQLADRTITLSKSNQTIVPSATVIDGDIEALGDGRTVKTEVKVSQVFDGKQESLEKPEVIPPEFRASLQNRTISEIKTGQAISLPSLSQEELSKTIQRVTEHKIRETKVTRPSDDYPELTGELVDNDQIKVTRTRTVAKGGQTITPSATVSGTVEALGDGYTLKTEDAKAKVFEARAFSKERPDNIPVEFRVEKPASTEEFNEEGDASEVSLDDTEIAKSEQQVNEFVKRVRTTARDDIGDVTLSEEQVDQDGVKVTVERQLSKGTQSISPSDTVRGQVQNLGGGYTVKTTLTRDEVLELPSFSVEKPDVVPAAFRSQVITTTEEKTITGDAEEPTLNDEDISRTERQIDKFLKRTTTVSRPETVSGELVGEQIENDGIKSTVTRTLSEGPQSITPSAAVSGNVEDIGDGLTIKTEIVKDEIFKEAVFSQEKPDNIPVEFRAEKPATVKEITEEGEAAEVSLSGDEISKSEQQVTKFLKRTRTATRDIIGGVTLAGGEQIDQDGVKVAVIRTLQDGPQSITPSATVSGQVEAIGDGKTIKTELTKNKVFDQKQNTISQTIQIPAKFIDREEEQDSYVEQREEAQPEPLGDGGFGVVQSSAQRVSEFTVRKNIRTISGVNGLSEKQLSNSGQEITIESSISDDPSIEAGAKVEIARTQAIGGGKFLKEIGKVDELFDAKQKTLSQSVQVPNKFFDGKPVETSTIEEGTAADPEDVGTNGFGILRSSAQRVNAFTIRKTKTEQSGVTSLTEKQTNNSGQEVTVESTIVNSPDVETGPTIEFSRTQSIGGGKFVKEVGTVGQVFSNRAISAEKPETIPAKFRVEIPNEVEEFTEEGAIGESIDLEENELSKSEQQIREGVRRTRTTRRSNVPSVSFTQKTTTNEKQLATVTESLQEEDTSEQPSATRTVQSEAIGDGKYITTVTEVDELFEARSETTQKPDVTPAKFRADIPTRVVEFNSIGEVEDTDLSESEISKREQQVDKFVKRTTTESRETPVAAIAEGQVYVSDLNGGTAKVVENFGTSPSISPSFGTISAEKEYLGDNKYVTREVRLEDFTTLSGQSYDEQFDVTIPFTREIVEAGELASQESAEIDPRNSLHSVKTIFNKEEIRNILLRKHIQSAEIVNISLPDVLESIEIIPIFTLPETEGEAEEQKGITLNINLIADIDYKITAVPKIKTGYSGPARAVKHLFFLEQEQSYIQNIFLKTGSFAWPAFQTQPVTVVARVDKTRTVFTYQRSLPDNYIIDRYEEPVSDFFRVEVPPTLHGDINLIFDANNSKVGIARPVQIMEIKTENGDVLFPYYSTFLNASASYSILKNTSQRTNFQSVPSGVYLYDVSVTPYRYGLMQVEAITVDLTPYE